MVTPCTFPVIYILNQLSLENNKDTFLILITNAFDKLTPESINQSIYLATHQHNTAKRVVAGIHVAQRAVFPWVPKLN